MKGVHIVVLDPPYSARALYVSYRVNSASKGLIMGIISVLATTKMNV